MSVSVKLYATLTKAIATEPRTVNHLAKVTGAKVRSTQILMGRMHALGFAHIASWKEATRGPSAACWRLGHGIDATRPVCLNGVVIPPRSPRPIRPALVGVELLHFVSLVRALAHPVSVQDLRAITGRSPSTLYRSLRALKSAGLAHVCEWDRERHRGAFTPLWKFGLDKKDAQRPMAFSVQELNRRYRSARRGRDQTLAVLRALASNNSVFNQAA